MPGDQLDLSIHAVTGGGRLPTRLSPMQPEEGVAPFDDPGYLFEAWWPGIRAQAWIEDGRLIRLRAEGLADALMTFGELSDELPGRLMEDEVLLDGDRCVVSHALEGEGTLLAEALSRFGLDAISARRLDARYRSGNAGDAWLRVPLTREPITERPRLALIQRLPFPDDAA